MELEEVGLWGRRDPSGQLQEDGEERMLEVALWSPPVEGCRVSEVSERDPPRHQTGMVRRDRTRQWFSGDGERRTQHSEVQCALVLAALLLPAGPSGLAGTMSLAAHGPVAVLMLAAAHPP